jgi:hypothetical protein
MHHEWMLRHNCLREIFIDLDVVGNFQDKTPKTPATWTMPGELGKVSSLDALILPASMQNDTLVLEC